MKTSPTSSLTLWTKLWTKLLWSARAQAYQAYQAVHNQARLVTFIAMIIYVCCAGAGPPLLGRWFDVMNFICLL